MKIEQVLKNNIKIVIAFLIGLVITGGVYAADILFASNEVSYDNTTSGLEATTVQGALDELYEKSGRIYVGATAVGGTITSNQIGYATSTTPAQFTITPIDSVKYPIAQTTCTDGATATYSDDTLEVTTSTPATCITKFGGYYLKYNATNSSSYNLGTILGPGMISLTACNNAPATLYYWTSQNAFDDAQGDYSTSSIITSGASQITIPSTATSVTTNPRYFYRWNGATNTSVYTGCSTIEKYRTAYQGSKYICALRCTNSDSLFYRYTKSLFYYPY